jgi:hypothetical protein
VIGQFHTPYPIFFIYFGATAPPPRWPRAAALTRFLELARADPQAVGLLRTSDQPLAETSTWQHTTLRHISMPAVGFETTISAGDWPQTYALDHVTTGTGPRTPYTLRMNLEVNMRL